VYGGVYLSVGGQTHGSAKKLKLLQSETVSI
jgi:hypothetical protein